MTLTLPSWISPAAAYAIIVLVAGVIISFAVRSATKTVVFEKQAELKLLGERKGEILLELDHLNAARHAHLVADLEEARASVKRLEDAHLEAVRELVLVRERVAGLEADNSTLLLRVRDLETQIDRQRARERVLECELIAHNIPVPPRNML